MWYNRRKNRPGHGQGVTDAVLSLYLTALESDGDKKQFRELYRRYHRVMERTALAVLHDPHDAEEAVQEAFLRVIENFSKIDEIPCKDLGGWLVIIVRNEAITILRRRRCHLPLEEGWADFAGQSRDLPAYSSMVQLFARLPDTYRAVLEMKLVLGYSTAEIARRLTRKIPPSELTDIPGTAYITDQVGELKFHRADAPGYEAVCADKAAYARATKIEYDEHDPIRGCAVVQPCEGRYLVVNPPARPLRREELDALYALPYTRQVHPMYKNGIPAIEEVQFSITHNRGCFGGCNFCALAFHQGRMVTSRSIESVLEEAELLTREPGFKGYIHDVGGPSANFRHTSCQKQKRCGMCKNRSCLAPEPCPNLDADHSEYTELLRRMREIPGIKRVFVRSGIRYDYMLQDKDRSFFKELVKYHISGQLKVAPEHCVSSVLDYMGKPHFDVFLKFWRQYQKLNEEGGTEQYLVPYLMSSHPGCTLSDAVELAEFLHKNGRTPEQVQDFYPTPGTLSTCMYYTGIDPRDMSEVYVARDPKEKAMQRALLQWSRPEKRALVVEALEETGRTDLIGYEKKCLIRPRKGEPYGQPPVKPERPERPERQPRRKKEASGNRGRRGTPTAKPLAQKGKMSPRKKAAFAKKRNGK